MNLFVPEILPFTNKSPETYASLRTIRSPEIDVFFIRAFPDTIMSPLTETELIDVLFNTVFPVKVLFPVNVLSLREPTSLILLRLSSDVFKSEFMFCR